MTSPFAPAGVHMIGHARADRLDLLDEAALDLEGLGDEDAGGPAEHAGRDPLARGRDQLRDRAGMVEHAEREDDAALLVHHHEAAVMDARHHAVEPGLELLL